MSCEIPIEVQKEIDRRETHKLLSCRGVTASMYLDGVVRSMFTDEEFVMLAQYRIEIQRLVDKYGFDLAEYVPFQALQQVKETFPEGAELSRQHTQIYHHLEATLLAD